MGTPVIRMYVDENGHQNLNGDLSNNDKRFLCLTGVIMPIKEHDTHLTPLMDELKVRYFGSTSIILHRRELISAKPPFDCLADPKTRNAFNCDLLNIIKEVRYRVISVVIDKYMLVQNYGRIRAQDPYALALEYLMQRYKYWMAEYAASYPHGFGDILAEARGKGEDRITKETYHEIYMGRGYNALNDSSLYFSSSQIKLKAKKDNIAGLQFVDLLSHPARRYILMQHGLGNSFKSSSFEQDIVDVLVQRKFRRNKYNGQIEGNGIVLYPK